MGYTQQITNQIALKTMKESLMLHVVGKVEDAVISSITSTIFEHGCYCVKSRYTTLGDHWSFVAQVDGQWNQLTKLESALKLKEKMANLKVYSQRCNDFSTAKALVPYTIEIIAPAKEELLHAVCKFLDTRKIMITEINFQTNDRNYTHTPVTSLTIKIYIPADTHLSDLQEQFMLLCDDLNIDAILEPEKR